MITNTTGLYGQYIYPSGLRGSRAHFTIGGSYRLNEMIKVNNKKQEAIKEDKKAKQRLGVLYESLTGAIEQLSILNAIDINGDLPDSVYEALQDLSLLKGGCYEIQ